MKNKHFTRKLCLIALLAFILGAAMLFAVGAETVSGKCGAEGDNLTWTLDTATGELIISGKGEMADYSESSSAPWYSYRESIETITVENGVTSIGDYAFYGCSVIGDDAIPESTARWEPDFAKMQTVDDNLGSSEYTIDATTTVNFYEIDGQKCLGFKNSSGQYIINDVNNVVKDCDVCYVEADMYFESYPSGIIGTDTPHTYPMSFMTWITTNDSGSLQYGSIRIDDEGYLCTKAVENSRLSDTAKLPLGEWFNIRFIISLTTKYCEVFIDHESVGTYHIGMFEPAEVTATRVRFLDSRYSYSVYFKNISVTSNTYSHDGLVIIPESVTSIGVGAFKDCTDLESAVILSDNAVIVDRKDTFPITATVYGYAGSTAQSYAEKYGREFVALEDIYQVTIESKTARVGDTVTVNITFDDTTDIKAIGLEKFSYNSSVLELVSGEWVGADKAVLKDVDVSMGLASLAFDDNTSTKGLSLVLTFKVSRGAAEGEYNIGCKAVITKMDGKVENKLTTAVTEGTISVRKFERGDVNGDEQVNTNDAIYLLRHVLFSDKFLINQSGDMNGDRAVNTNDAIYLLRHVLFGDRFPLAEGVPECTHKNSLKKTGNDKTPTCTEEGYIERRCTKCGEYVYEPIDKIAHAYSEVKSLDGKYVKKICTMCRGAVVVDLMGAVIADASAIKFPIFAGTFEGVDTLYDLDVLFDGFALTPTFANIIKNDPNGEIYLNVPSGNVAVAPNGCLDVIDERAQLVGEAFTLTFLAKYEETPTKPTALLTWTVGGKKQVILSADINGNYLDAKGNVLATSRGKGWDSFKVEFAADGSYAVSLNGTKIGSGTVVTKGATSAFRFFDNRNQFEAFLDEIIIAK